MQPHELLKAMQAKNPPVLLDVRNSFEFRRGYIPGAVHAPTWKILLKLAKLPQDRDTQLVVTCELGPRAGMAQALLRAYGYRKVVLLVGQMAGWRRSGLPLRK